MSTPFFICIISSYSPDNSVSVNMILLLRIEEEYISCRNGRMVDRPGGKRTDFCEFEWNIWLHHFTLICSYAAVITLYFGNTCLI